MVIILFMNFVFLADNIVVDCDVDDDANDWNNRLLQ